MITLPVGLGKIKAPFCQKVDPLPCYLFIKGLYNCNVCLHFLLLTRIQILYKSPMVEMRRRTPKEKTPGKIHTLSDEDFKSVGLVNFLIIE